MSLIWFHLRMVIQSQLNKFTQSDGCGDEDTLQQWIPEEMLTSTVRNGRPRT